MKPRGCQVKSETMCNAKGSQATLCCYPCRSRYSDCAGSFDWKTQASVLRSDAESLGKYSPTFRKITVPSSSCLRNDGKYLRNHTASHPHTLQSSATLSRFDIPVVCVNIM